MFWNEYQTLRGLSVGVGQAQLVPHRYLNRGVSDHLLLTLTQRPDQRVLFRKVLVEVRHVQEKLVVLVT